MPLSVLVIAAISAIIQKVTTAIKADRKRVARVKSITLRLNHEESRPPLACRAVHVEACDGSHAIHARRLSQRIAQALDGVEGSRGGQASGLGSSQLNNFIK